MLSDDQHHPQKRKLSTPKKKTRPLLWCVVVICTIMTVAVIIVGIVVFVMYLVIHPRVPIISVVNGHLNTFQYNIAGTLVTQVSIVVRSENDNLKAHASFSNFRLTLIFEGMEIAKLVADPYDVPKNTSVDFNFLATSAPIPLNPAQMQNVDVFLNRDRIWFDLRGSVRARWRVGPLGSVRFQSNLNCQLNFHRSNGSYIPTKCTSKSK